MDDASLEVSFISPIFVIANVSPPIATTTAANAPTAGKSFSDGTMDKAISDAATMPIAIATLFKASAFSFRENDLNTLFKPLPNFSRSRSINALIGVYTNSIMSKRRFMR